MLFRMASGFSQQAGFRLSGIRPRFPLKTRMRRVILLNENDCPVRYISPPEAGRYVLQGIDPHEAV